MNESSSDKVDPGQSEDAKQFLDGIREELRYWPYTIHQIDDTLDASLIEGRGKQILYQALNSKMLSVFVGSGVSAAYGRMSWTSWKSEQLRSVQELSQCFLKLADSSLSLMKLLENLTLSNPYDPANILSQRWLHYRQQVIRHARWEIENLTKTFDAGHSKNGYFPGGEDIPVLFEIAKKLHDLLLQHRTLYLDPVPLSDAKSAVNEKNSLFFGSRVDVRDGAPLTELTSLRKYLKKTGLPNDVDGAVRDYRKIYDTYKRLNDEPSAKMSFHQLAKTLLVDECEHAKKLFYSGLKTGHLHGRRKGNNKKTEKRLKDISEKLSNDGLSNLKRDIDGIRQNPERYTVLSVFKFKLFTEEHIQNHILDNNTIPAPWIKLYKRLNILFSNYDDTGAPLKPERVFLTPTSRFLVPMLMQMLEKPLDLYKADSVYKKAFSPPSPDDFYGRRSILADRFDPISKLATDLGINRYLTTNYDFEIERYYQDIGYNRFDTHYASKADIATDSKTKARIFRTNGMGGVLSDMTFSTETATDLISFSARGDGADASIFHLHGRATSDDEIVVTERDYMDMYLRDDPNREIVDESILMAFAASPILFLGLGMSESDLLRPLRQFISDNDRSIAYKTIVLLDASKDFESRAKMSAGLYVRYGAHTIFYGGGEIDDLDEQRPQSIDWLHRITLLNESLTKKALERKDQLVQFVEAVDDADFLNRLLSDCNGKVIKKSKDYFDRALTSLSQLNDDLKKLGPDTSGKNLKIPALRILLGLSTKEFEQFLGMDESQFIDKLNLQNCQFTTRRQRQNSEVYDYRQTRIDGTKYTDFYIQLLTEFMTIALSPPEKTRTVGMELRSLNALITGLEGVRGALLTACLNAALEGIEKEWRQWWKDWQKAPPSREAKFERIRSDAEEGQFNIPPRHVRHRVQSVITDLSDCNSKLADPNKIVDGVLEPIKQSKRTGVRMFDRFVDDLRIFAANRVHRQGRLIHTVAASRGQGKGVFFSVLQTKLGLSSYISAAHPERERVNTRPVFVSAIYINLSFSAEIGSVYQMVLNELKNSIVRLKLALKIFDNFHVNMYMSEQLDNRLYEIITSVDIDSPELSFDCGFDLKKEIAIQQYHLNEKIKSASRTDQLTELTLWFKELGFEYQKAYLNRRKKLPLDASRAYSIPQPRIFIAVNAPELLFDNNCKPKNLEISDILSLISSPKSRNMPIDLLFVGAIELLGSFWTSKKSPLRVTRVPTEAEEAFSNEEYQSIKEQIKYNAKKNNVSSLENGKVYISSKTHFVHFAWPVNPVQFLADNFLTLATALLLARIHRSSNKIDAPVIDKNEFAKVLKHAHSHLWESRNPIWQQVVPPDASKEYIQTRLTMHEEIVSSIEDLESIVEYLNVPIDTIDIGWTELFRSSLINSYKSNSKASASLRDNDVRDWDELLRVLGGNRFCLTILMAAAEHLVFTTQCIVDGGNIANSMLQNVVSQLRNASVSEKENVILKTVMDVYHSTSVIGSPDQDHQLHELLLRNLAVLGCPVSPNVLVRLPDVREYFNTSQISLTQISSDSSGKATHDPRRITRRRIVARALSTLCERGLVFRLSPHPKLLKLQKLVEPKWEAKATIDEFQAHLEKKYKSKAQTKRRNVNDALDAIFNGPASENGFLERMLQFVLPDEINTENSEGIRDLLEFRRQVSNRVKEELRNSSTDSEEIDLVHAFDAFAVWPASREYRYSLHRQVQSYCFHRLGHLTASPVSVNNYAPTLYASTPSRVIRLSSEGYLFLRRLMVGLSQYPDIRHIDSTRDLPIFSDDNVITKVQALRAALSMARTVFSIAAVSRFNDSTMGIHYSRKRGYFETYKVRLRWILRKSWEVHEPSTGKNRSQNNDNRVNALYLDEIVWLCNEVAVTCLVQGVLTDGIGHIRQALYVNRMIEGDAPGGRMHNMLSLNLSIMQIERGRLGSAKRRLREIIDSEQPHHKKVYSLATGYLALVAQLEGRLEDAKRNFIEATESLQELSEYRAVAIMKHHLARLEARDDVRKARVLLDNARQASESGGHEDIRHRILLSEVWLSQHFEKESIDRIREDRIKLREVESYALMMDIPSLLVDCLHAKGTILLQGGDTSTSGKLMTRAMAIARRNDMTLRLNSIMTNYSRVLIARRRGESAIRLLESALAMAKRSGYSIEVMRIHEALSDAKRTINAD